MNFRYWLCEKEGLNETVSSWLTETTEYQCRPSFAVKELTAIEYEQLQQELI